MKEQVLKAMREFGAPVNAGKIAEITGLDRKDVDKVFAELKKEGAIVSPVRCKWEPAQKSDKPVFIANSNPNPPVPCKKRGTGDFH